MCKGARARDKQMEATEKRCRGGLDGGGVDAGFLSCPVQLLLNWFEVDWGSLSSSTSEDITLLCCLLAHVLSPSSPRPSSFCSVGLYPPVGQAAALPGEAAAVDISPREPVVRPNAPTPEQTNYWLQATPHSRLRPLLHSSHSKIALILSFISIVSRALER